MTPLAPGGTKTQFFNQTNCFKAEKDCAKYCCDKNPNIHLSLILQPECGDPEAKRDLSGPMRGQYPGHVTSVDQSEARLPTPRFTRTVSGPVVHLSSAPRQDVAPPSRIGDLLITPTDNKETAINNHNSEAPQHIKIFLPVV